MQDKGKPNLLIQSSSPYLLQHAYNPVAWREWNEESLAAAKDDHKPILLSIGYSSCHWCHVMERESFENQEIAEIMNQHFICIKVDREERPDVDQVYMEAVQVMGLNGGWPLNAFLTPDKKPFYGGTYFPPAKWKNLLLGIAQAYDENKEKLEESANNFAEAIAESELEKYALIDIDPVNFSKEKLLEMHDGLAPQFDHQYGGMLKEPKFPMPSLWRFLMDFAYGESNIGAIKHLQKTLLSMAAGGIYDQIGGGFSRYAVDNRWFAPHFEKMLYDNAQLISLYAKASMLENNPIYNHVISQTISWIERDMLSEDGGFYSALDADTENVEGKFYTWTWGELRQLLSANELTVASNHYHLTELGNWEAGTNILYTSIENTRQNENEISSINATLLEARQKRVKPGLDDKILASWNGLMISALIDAYIAVGDEKALVLAINNANFIGSRMIHDGILHRSFKKNVSANPAYLEDYAAVSIAFIDLFEVTGNSQWLQQSKALIETGIEQFYDSQEGFFFYTAKNSERLIARKKELFDNVIPSSNAMFARAIYKLNRYYNHSEYQNIVHRMVLSMANLMVKDVQYLSHWASTWYAMGQPQLEVVCAGPLALEWVKTIKSEFPFLNVASCAIHEAVDHIPALLDKEQIENQTVVYVCKNQTCHLPDISLNNSIKTIKELLSV